MNNRNDKKKHRQIVLVTKHISTKDKHFFQNWSDILSSGRIPVSYMHSMHLEWEWKAWISERA